MAIEMSAMLFLEKAERICEKYFLALKNFRGLAASTEMVLLCHGKFFYPRAIN